jgi:hypothetical protein
MHEIDGYSISVLARDKEGHPLKISINGKAYESIDSGVFIIPLRDIENLRLGALGLLGISVDVIARIRKNGVLEGIPYSILHAEVEYASDRAYVKIFEFKPWKYLDLRRGRRKIFYMDVLKAYFAVLKKANELDPRVIPSDKMYWHYDSEEAEAYLEIKLSADMTVKQAVREVKRIFRKIDQSAIRILEDIIRKKERRKKNGTRLQHCWVYVFSKRVTFSVQAIVYGDSGPPEEACSHKSLMCFLWVRQVLLEPLGLISGCDAHHQCCTGLFLQSLSIPQVLSCREALFRHTLHSRPQLEGSIREIMSNRCV